MSFSIFNILASFQSYINKSLAKKLDIFVIVYRNNILVYTKDLRQLHIDVGHWILEQAQKYALFANVKKYCIYLNGI